MSQPPIVFEKSFMDFSQPGINITVTDPNASDIGNDVKNSVRDRTNVTGWGTLDSIDASNTEFLVDLSDHFGITDILLIGHNFKNYVLEYWDGATFQNIVTVTNNTETVTAHNLSEQQSSQIKLTINATMVVDDDKHLSQMIVTKRVGQFERFPIIVPTHSKNRKRLKTVSGKLKIARSTGASSFAVSDNNVISDNDLDIVEKLFDTVQGLLFWPSGGDSSQFRTDRVGFRLQDIYLVGAENDYTNPWGSNGHYDHGTNYAVRLTEVV